MSDGYGTGSDVYGDSAVDVLPGRRNGKSWTPVAPTGVVLRAPVLDPKTGLQKRNKYKRLMFTEYTCRTVYAGRLTDIDDAGDFQDIWQVVCDRWMHPGDQIVAATVPAHAVLIGPPPAITAVRQEVSHA
ncbi:hypothetical protein CH300_19965 [Rhodococcus sp. 15-1154-1]|nr:hypothetical protein CH300_19965 [Rhodococcus sp. 15-1154-1]